jgi:hypothetical protein
MPTVIVVYQTIPVGTIDRRPFSERAKLSDRGLVDFRRVCDQMRILDRETDTIRPGHRRGKHVRACASRD